MHQESRLLDMEELGKQHPALRNRYRIQYLIRSRKIPIVKIGRRVYFEEEAINIWIKYHSIPAQDGD